MYAPKKYAPSYWHAASPDGKDLPGQIGIIHDRKGAHGKPFVNIDADDVPDDAMIYVLGMHEEVKGDGQKTQQHWDEFHKVIDSGNYVRLCYGGPLTADGCKDKVEAEAKYGSADREGFEKNSGKDRRTKVVNLTEFISDTKYFIGWNEAELGWVRSGDIAGILFVIWHRMHEAGVEFESLYGIIHDLDERMEWSPVDAQEHKVRKDDHFHILGRINKGRTPEQIAKILGVNEECLTLPKNRYSWDNFLAYLLHIKYLEKHLYEPGQVVTLVGKVFGQIYAERHHDWMVGRSLQSDNHGRHDAPYYLDKVRLGELTVHQMMLDDEQYLIYSRHQKQFDEAQALARKRIDARRLEDFRAKKFSKTSIYVSGPSRSGKSTIIKALGHACSICFGWPYDPDDSLVSDKNSLEQAHGLYIIDGSDTSSNAFGSPKGLIRQLDPYNAGATAERFHNGDPLVYSLLCISNTEPVLYFYGSDFYNAREDVSQLLARFSSFYVRMPAELFGDEYCWAVLRPVECDPRVVSFPHANPRTGERDEAYQKGVIFVCVPVSVPDPSTGKNVPAIYTPAGVIRDCLHLLNARNGHPLDGFDEQFLIDAAQKGLEKEFGAAGLYIPDPSLDPWVPITRHPRVIEAKQKDAASQQKMLKDFAIADRVKAVAAAHGVEDPSSWLLISKKVDAAALGARFQAATGMTLAEAAGLSSDEEYARWYRRYYDKVLKATSAEDVIDELVRAFNNSFHRQKELPVSKPTNRNPSPGTIKTDSSGW